MTGFADEDFVVREDLAKYAEEILFSLREIESITADILFLVQPKESGKGDDL